MRKNIFNYTLAIVLYSIANVLSAQTVNVDSLNAVYEKETIYLDGTTDKYVKNKLKKRIGVFGQKLNQEFAHSSSEAKQEMDLCVKNKKRTVVLLGVSAVALTATIILLPEITAAVAFTGLGIALTADIMAAVNLVKVPRHLNKAIWLHNRDVLKQINP
jgi:hypothetical protein